MTSFRLLLLSRRLLKPRSLVSQSQSLYSLTKPNPNPNPNPNPPIPFNLRRWIPPSYLEFNQIPPPRRLLRRATTTTTKDPSAAMTTRNQNRRRRGSMSICRIGYGLTRSWPGSISPSGRGCLLGHVCGR